MGVGTGAWRSGLRVLIGLLTTWATAAAALASPPPDVIITDAKVYTADPAHRIVEAVAIRSGLIVYVGPTAAALKLAGPATRIESAHGRLILPGLIDSHIHPTDILALDVCDLKNKPQTLRELSAEVKGCLERYNPSPGQWLTVDQWSYPEGNQPDADNPTIRAALDHASTRHPIQLVGTDGHHAAMNSLALSLAKDSHGQAVGLSKASLATTLHNYRRLVGVDAEGEPNGMLQEDARRLPGGPDPLTWSLGVVAKAPQRITAALNRAGITGVLDAEVVPEMLPIYEQLSKSVKLTLRATLAQLFEPEKYRAPKGEIDWARLLAQAEAVRARFAHDPLLRADVVKVFADGVLEGNPKTVPPTLPNSLRLQPFEQPIYGEDPQGNLTVTGYVDPDSAACREVAAHPQSLTSPLAVANFRKAHGHHPGQCEVSSGQLRHEPAVFREYVKRMHRAGFSVHIHAIGDGSVRAAIDAIEEARASDGISTTRDGLAHLQVVHPDDIARLGCNHLYAVFTYAWMFTAREYDLTVIPFFERVRGNSFLALHNPQSYYERYAYPVRAVQEAGGILCGSSDAPVETRDPRPFQNIAQAVTRRRGGTPALNPSQSIEVREAIDSYTINGARHLGRADECGSLEVGKSADFVVVDQDLFALAKAGHADAIAKTRVLATWFRGVPVYRADAP